MTEKKFTNELKSTFDYIKNNILKEYETDKITTEYFVVSILENETSVGNKVLSKIMLHDSIENAKQHFYLWLSQNARTFGGAKEYDDVFDICIKQSKEYALQQKSKTINSGHVLMSILKNNIEISKYFKTLGVTYSQVSVQVVAETINGNEEETKNKDAVSPKEKPFKHVKLTKNKPSDNTSKLTNTGLDFFPSTVPSGECERLFHNLNKEANCGRIETICGNEKIYAEIFAVLSKRNKNNIIITGESGVGKTDTVKNLANMIVNKHVPNSFLNKVLFEVDFDSLFMNTAIRGSFEAKTKSIVTEAKQRGNYIFFIDGLSDELSNKMGENGIGNFVETLILEKNIMLICTCLEKDYQKEIGDKPQWCRYFERIKIEEPTEEKCLEILKDKSDKLSYFHNVIYDNDVYSVCIKYCKRYITEKYLPDSAIDILDKCGAKKSLVVNENDSLKEARQKLCRIISEKDKLKTSSSQKGYYRINQLEQEEIETKSLLDFALKKHNLEKEIETVTVEDIKECVSEKTNIPLGELTIDDKEKLKDINDKIKKIIIGQDEAVDGVCKAIKRQRVGISNPNKPVVFLMAGNTGVGKTYLAKTIAKELFGDENKFVKLDMAEYGDAMGAATLIGAGKGYVGFDSGGILTEAVKKNKHCVLLLDEIEKADEKVHNLFLSVFDEGHLMDNKGVSVDFKNVIVVMTSNVGAKEIDERGNGIGFVGNSENIKKNIIDKELKKKFKPEFLNRIDKIVYFNNLTDENLKEIIKLEINKLRKRIEEIGYKLDENICSSKLFEEIYMHVKGKKKQGARPIVREIQEQIEDKITDKIIDEQLPKGFTFIFD